MMCAFTRISLMVARNSAISTEVRKKARVDKATAVRSGHRLNFRDEIQDILTPAE